MGQHVYCAQTPRRPDAAQVGTEGLEDRLLALGDAFELQAKFVTTKLLSLLYLVIFGVYLFWEKGGDYVREAQRRPIFGVSYVKRHLQTSRGIM